MREKSKKRLALRPEIGHFYSPHLVIERDFEGALIATNCNLRRVERPSSRSIDVKNHDGIGRNWNVAAPVWKCAFAPEIVRVQPAGPWFKKLFCERTFWGIQDLHHGMIAAPVDP